MRTLGLSIHEQRSSNYGVTRKQHQKSLKFVHRSSRATVKESKMKNTKRIIVVHNRKSYGWTGCKHVHLVSKHYCKTSWKVLCSFHRQPRSNQTLNVFLSYPQQAPFQDFLELGELSFSLYLQRRWKDKISSFPFKDFLNLHFSSVSNRWKRGHLFVFPLVLPFDGLLTWTELAHFVDVTFTPV